MSNKALFFVICFFFFIVAMPAYGDDPLRNKDGFLIDTSGKKIRIWLKFPVNEAPDLNPFQYFFYGKLESSGKVRLFRYLGLRKIGKELAVVPIDTLSFRTEALRSGELHQKAFLANKEDDLNIFSSNIRLFQGPRYSYAPSIDYVNSDPEGNVKEKKFRIFRHVYIYDRKETDSGEWLLVGKKETLPGSGDLESILGWVPAGNAVPWPTISGIQHNQKNYKKRASDGNLTYIFQNKEDLITCLKEANPNICEPSQNANPEKGKGWQPTSIRYPILDVKKLKEQIYYKVAYITGAISNADEISSNACNHVVVGLINNVEKIDVVMLIDSSGSFQPYMEKISLILDEIKSTTKLDIRVGLAFYRDKFPGSNSKRPWKAYPLTGNFRKLNDILKKEAEKAGEGKKSPPARWATERVLTEYFEQNQLYNEESNKNLGAGVRIGSTRYIVLIGDHGSVEEKKDFPSLERNILKKLRIYTGGGGILVIHQRNLFPPKSDQAFYSFFSKSLLEGSMCKETCKFKGSPKSFYTLSWLGPDQCNKTCNETNIQAKYRAEYFPVQTPEEAAQALAKALLKKIQNFEKTADFLKETWERQEMEQITSVFTPAEVAFVKEKLNQLAIAYEEQDTYCFSLDYLSKQKFQLFNTGYVPLKNPITGQEQLSVMNFTTKRKWSKLNHFLQDLVERVENEGTSLGGALERAVKKLLENLFNDQGIQFEEENLTNMIRLAIKENLIDTHSLKIIKEVMGKRLNIETNPDLEAIQSHLAPQDYGKIFDSFKQKQEQMAITLDAEEHQASWVGPVGYKEAWLPIEWFP